MIEPDGNEVVATLAQQIGEQAATIAVLRSRLRLAEEALATQPAADGAAPA